MFWDRVDDLLRNTPLGLLGVALPVLMGLAVLGGMAIRQMSHRRARAHEPLPGEGLEGVMVSALPQPPASTTSAHRTPTRCLDRMFVNPPSGR